jgi:hypothetical protein
MSFSQLIFLFLQKQLPVQEQAVWEEALAAHETWRMAIEKIEDLLKQEPLLQEYFAEDVEGKARFELACKQNSELSTQANALAKHIDVIFQAILIPEDAMIKTLQLLKNEYIVDKVIADIDTSEWDKEVADITVSPIPDNKKVIPLWRNRVFQRVAAILILSMGLLWWINPFSKKIVYDHAYFSRTYFDSPYAASTHLGEVDDEQKAIDLYNQYQYKETIKLLSNYPNLTPNLHLILANAFMKEQQFSQAIPLLEQAVQFPDYANEGHKYLAICYVLSGDNAAANAELSNLLHNGNAQEKEWASQLKRDLLQKK